MAYDPWSGSFADAVRYGEASAEEKEKNIGDPTRPIFQFAAAKRIEALKPLVEAGDGFSVLDCINQCVSHGLVAPRWLACAFSRRYNAVNQCHANSWDSPLSFGRPYKKNANISAMRKERVGVFEVYVAVCEKLQKFPIPPIDKGFFAEVGKPLGYGATLTEEYFYKALKMGFPHPTKNEMSRMYDLLNANK